MVKDLINDFRGEYRFLSNFHYSLVEYKGILYSTLEGAFQAAKTPFPQERVQFETMRPDRAKQKGRYVTLRDDWEDVKVSIMAELIKDKFSRHQHLRDLLLKTGDAELVEGNWWGDDFWGVCTPSGLNILGRLLMRERDAIRRSL